MRNFVLQIYYTFAQPGVKHPAVMLSSPNHCVFITLQNVFESNDSLPFVILCLTT